ncbi:unnamed protein product [Sympodiomycopsis kandeliae]
MSEETYRTESTFIQSSDPSIDLEARIAHPCRNGQNIIPAGLAIVAHPYGFLGGSLSDPVTLCIGRVLAEASGYRTVRFNSRGVGQSGGKGSWTGEAEANDYQCVVDQSVQQFAQDFPQAQGRHLVIAGYSAGSLYASAVRISTLPQQFDPESVTYILVSYPLDKIWALSLFHASKWSQRLGELVFSSSTVKPNRVLVIQGSQDEFTKSSNYSKWIHTLKLEAQKHNTSDRLMILTREGATHFWNSVEHLQALLDFISDNVH